jgi:excisionase family DNA binding protein
VRPLLLADLAGETTLENILASIPEAVRMLSVGRSTLYRLIGEGKLDTVKIGRRTLIPVASIKAVAGQHAPVAQPAQ